MGGTENAVIQKTGLHACVMSVGQVTIVHPLIFVLVHHADNTAYVKIILLILPAFVTTVTLDINAKRLIFVSKTHAKIMELVYHIQMVTSATASTCGRVRSVMKGTFVFWITLVIRMAIVPWFSLMLDALVYLVGLVHFAVFQIFVIVHLVESMGLVKTGLVHIIAFVIGSGQEKIVKSMYAKISLVVTTESVQRTCPLRHTAVNVQMDGLVITVMFQILVKRTFVKMEGHVFL